MDKGQVLRRLVHISAPVFLVYYYLPDPIFPGFVAKQPGIFLFLALILVIEALRLYFSPHIIGMRDYENYRISAAAWTAMSLTLTLAFFPLEIAFPVVLGMGWVDPVMGILRARKSRYYPAVPIVLYFMLMIIPLSYFFGLTPLVVLASLAATFLGIMSEVKKNWYLDDDFLMIVVPLVGLFLIFKTAGLI
jgi:hypothetical protein